MKSEVQNGDVVEGRTDGNEQCEQSEFGATAYEGIVGLEVGAATLSPSVVVSALGNQQLVVLPLQTGIFAVQSVHLTLGDQLVLAPLHEQDGHVHLAYLAERVVTARGDQPENGA